MAYNITLEEINALWASIRAEKKGLAQAILNVKAAHERQHSETGIDFPTYGADYGACDRRVITKEILSKLDKRERKLLEDLVCCMGPHPMTVNIWKKKYVNDGYTNFKSR